MDNKENGLTQEKNVSKIDARNEHTFTIIANQTNQIQEAIFAATNNKNRKFKRVKRQSNNLTGMQFTFSSIR